MANADKKNVAALTCPKLSVFKRYLFILILCIFEFFLWVCIYALRLQSQKRVSGLRELELRTV